MNVNDDLDKLIETIPFFLQEHLNKHAKRDKLVEIVLDLGNRQTTIKAVPNNFKKWCEKVEKIYIITKDKKIF